MSEKHLLLYSAKTAVLVETQPKPHWFRTIAIGLGVLAVVIGASDALTRFSTFVFGDRAAFVAFAPAAALLDPSLMGGATTSVASTTSIIPARLIVPAIGINAAVESVGKKADGSMGTPTTFYTTAWYNLGPKPGEPGNAVIDGHVNNALTTAGVFEHLDKVQLGDTLQVADSAGKTLSYVVDNIQDYPRDSAPLDTIFASTGPSQVVLITCDGDWDPKADSYDKRLVVIARLSGL